MARRSGRQNFATISKSLREIFTKAESVLKRLTMNSTLLRYSCFPKRVVMVCKQRPSQLGNGLNKKPEMLYHTAFQANLM